MKKIFTLCFLVLSLQPLISNARTQYNFYDDPKNQHYHNQFKVKKHKAKAKKLSLSKSYPKIMNLSRFKLKKIDIHNDTDVNLNDITSSYLGHVADNKTVKNLLNEINTRLHDKGYILSFAYMPKQSLDNGNVKIQVVNGKIRDVKVISDSEVSKNDLFNKYVSNILEMNPVRNNDIQKNIQLINLIPGYNIKYDLEPVNEPSSLNEVADLVLIVDKEAGDITFSANNQGTKSIGKYQYYTLVNLYNTLNANEKLSIHGGSTNKFDALKLATIDFEKFINSYGTSLNLMGSYVEDNPYVVLPGNASKNKSTLVRGSIGHYLLLKRNESIKFNLGYEHRNSENNTVGTKVSNLKYANVFISSEIEYKDFLKGKNFAIINYSRSIPNNTKIKRYDSSAQLLDRNYNFTTLDLYREQNLYKNFSLFNQFLSQFSSNNIPVEQQFFVGGLTTGRGYKNGLLSSNRGLDFAAEIRYTHKFNNLIEEVMPYGFYDITKFSKSSAGSNKSSLQSAGFGIKLRTKYDVNILLESGFPFTKKITVDGVENHNSNKFSFTVGKEFKF